MAALEGWQMGGSIWINTLIISASQTCRLRVRLKKYLKYQRPRLRTHWIDIQSDTWLEDMIVDLLLEVTMVTSTPLCPSRWVPVGLGTASNIARRQCYGRSEGQLFSMYILFRSSPAIISITRRNIHEQHPNGWSERCKLHIVTKPSFDCIKSRGQSIEVDPMYICDRVYQADYANSRKETFHKERLIFGACSSTGRSMRDQYKTRIWC